MGPLSIAAIPPVESKGDGEAKSQTVAVELYGEEKRSGAVANAIPIADPHPPLPRCQSSSTPVIDFYSCLAATAPAPTTPVRKARVAAIAESPISPSIAVLHPALQLLDSSVIDQSNDAVRSRLPSVGVAVAANGPAYVARFKQPILYPQLMTAATPLDSPVSFVPVPDNTLRISVLFGDWIEGRIRTGCDRKDCPGPIGLIKHTQDGNFRAIKLACSVRGCGHTWRHTNYETKALHLNPEVDETGRARRTTGRGVKKDNVRAVITALISKISSVNYTLHNFLNSQATVSERSFRRVGLHFWRWVSKYTQRQLELLQRQIAAAGKDIDIIADMGWGQRGHHANEGALVVYLPDGQPLALIIMKKSRTLFNKRDKPAIGAIKNQLRITRTGNHNGSSSSMEPAAHRLLHQQLTERGVLRLVRRLCMDRDGACMAMYPSFDGTCGPHVIREVRHIKVRFVTFDSSFP